MEKVSIGSFELHISHTAILKMPEGLSYVITLPEAYVLKKLSTEIGQLVSRKDLEQAGWGSLQATGVNSLAVAISNLRKILKLGKIEIINEPRRGYKLVIDEHIDNYSKINFINEPTNIETKNTITKRNKLEFIFHMYSKLFISLSLMMISLVFILFFSLSWVHVDCEHFSENKVCYFPHYKNQLDKFDFKHETYISSSSEYIEIIDNE